MKRLNFTPASIICRDGSVIPLPTINVVTTKNHHIASALIVATIGILVFTEAVLVYLVSWYIGIDPIVGYVPSLGVCLLIVFIINKIINKSKKKDVITNALVVVGRNNSMRCVK